MIRGRSFTLQGEAEGSGLVESGGEMASGGPNNSLPSTNKDATPRRWSHTLEINEWEEDKTTAISWKKRRSDWT